MSAQPIRKGATHKVVIGGFYDVGDGFVPETGVTLSGADEAEAILHDNGTVVSISGYTWAAIASADGFYHLTLQTAITNTVGHLTIVVQDDSVCLPVWKDFIVMDTAAYDTLYAATSTIQTSFDLGLIIQGSITTVTGQQEFILDSGISVDDSLIGHEVALEDKSTGHLYASKNGQGIWISDVVASSNTVKISSLFPVTVVTSDDIRIYVPQHPQYIIDTYDPPTRTEAAADRDSILAKSLAYARLMTRKDAGPTTDDSTELTAINANSGAGGGSYVAGDSLEATQDDVGALNDLATSDILTQVNAALDTAISELGVGAPTATPTLRTGLIFLYMALRNLRTTTASADVITNTSGTQICSSTVSDDAVTYTKTEYS